MRVATCCPGGRAPAAATGPVHVRDGRAENLVGVLLEISKHLFRVYPPRHFVPPRPAQLAASSWAFGGSKVHCLSPALRAGSPHLLRNPASPLTRRGSSVASQK